jgi:hypothetical protein
MKAFACWLLWLVALGAAPARPAGGPAGLWALRSDGATLFTVEVRRGPRGWTGIWTRPEHFSFSGDAVSGVSGPVVRRASIAGRETGDGGIELTFDDPQPNSSPDKLTVRPLDARRGALAWAQVTDRVRIERGGAGMVPSALPSRRYPVQHDRPTNAEMTALFEADQAARADPARIDWAVVGPQDAARQKRTKALLDAGALNSGDDFWHAAFIFQHGGKPEDYLLAHSLAIIAAARGRPDATWIAAATLDRYLQAIGQKQVYGTQYMSRPGQPTTQEPYDRALLSDALRTATGVPVQAEQEKRRAEFETMYRTPAPAPKR